MNRVKHYLKPAGDGQDTGPEGLASYIEHSGVQVIYAKLERYPHEKFDHHLRILNPMNS